MPKKVGPWLVSAAVVAALYYVYGPLTTARRLTRVKTQLTAYDEALRAYYSGHERFPEPSQITQALNWRPDPWGNTYRYVWESQKSYTLSSDGPDGKSGTDDDVRSPASSAP
jgi:type II secretory pathway pseudopilin PulG